MPDSYCKTDLGSKGQDAHIEAYGEQKTAAFDRGTRLHDRRRGVPSVNASSGDAG